MHQTDALLRRDAVADAQPRQAMALGERAQQDHPAAIADVAQGIRPALRRDQINVSFIQASYYVRRQAVHESVQIRARHHEWHVGLLGLEMKITLVRGVTARSMASRSCV